MELNNKKKTMFLIIVFLVILSIAGVVGWFIFKDGQKSKQEPGKSVSPVTTKIVFKPTPLKSPKDLKDGETEIEEEPSTKHEVKFDDNILKSALSLVVPPLDQMTPDLTKYVLKEPVQLLNKGLADVFGKDDWYGLLCGVNNTSRDICADRTTDNRDVSHTEFINSIQCDLENLKGALVEVVKTHSATFVESNLKAGDLTPAQALSNTKNILQRLKVKVHQTVSFNNSPLLDLLVDDDYLRPVPKGAVKEDSTKQFQTLIDDIKQYLYTPLIDDKMLNNYIRSLVNGIVSMIKIKVPSHNFLQRGTMTTIQTILNRKAVARDAFQKSTLESYYMSAHQILTRYVLLNSLHDLPARLTSAKLHMERDLAETKKLLDENQVLLEKQQGKSKTEEQASAIKFPLTITMLNANLVVADEFIVKANMIKEEAYREAYIKYVKTTGKQPSAEILKRKGDEEARTRYAPVYCDFRNRIVEKEVERENASKVMSEQENGFYRMQFYMNVFKLDIDIVEKTFGFVNTQKVPE